MRLAGQIKGGYYPAPESTIETACSYLAVKPGTTILDPCAGEGKAIEQIKNLTEGDCYAIELADNRAERIPDGIEKLHASFFGCQISFSSFGVVWLNPPYDDEFRDAEGSGRVEETFLRRAIQVLAPRGVLVCLVPERIVGQYGFRNVFAQYLHKHQIVHPPESPFGEVLVFGEKRDQPVGAWQGKWETHDGHYTPFHGKKPEAFFKKEPTDAELEKMLAESPLDKLINPRGEAEIARPILPLGSGHRGLLLASGHIDGVVRPKGEEPHVVRGIAHKEAYCSSSETEETEKGSRTKTVMSERIKLTIRTLDSMGNLVTLTEE